MALLADLPNLDPELFQAPSLESLGLPPSSRPAPKVLLLYGSPEGGPGGRRHARQVSAVSHLEHVLEGITGFRSSGVVPRMSVGTYSLA